MCFFWDVTCCFGLEEYSLFDFGIKLLFPAPASKLEFYTEIKKWIFFETKATSDTPNKKTSNSPPHALHGFSVAVLRGQLFAFVKRNNHFF